MVLAAAAVISGGLLAGLCAWLGAASQHSGMGLPSLLAAGTNAAVPALCVLAAGIFAFGAWPRVTTVAVYGLLAWSLMIELAGGFFGSNHWLPDTSVFHQMAAAPAVRPDWVSAAALAVLAAHASGRCSPSCRDLRPRWAGTFGPAWPSAGAMD